MISDNGARIAFVFLMLFLITLAMILIALTATGLSFEDALALAVAALTTTGPAIGALGSGVGYGDLQPMAQAILCVAMVVGRMEALVIVALFNPASWRQ
jgi:trk system potassium uptake protein